MTNAPTTPPLPEGFTDTDLVRAALTEYCDNLADDIKDRWSDLTMTADDEATVRHDEVILDRIRWLLTGM